MNCFGDNEQYTNFLFDRLLRLDDILIYEQDNNIAAMLCLQPFTLVTPHDSAPGAYVFGVATMPQWRKKGFSTELLLEAERQLAERKTVLTALVPAGETLFHFYENRGYETIFSICRAVLSDSQIPVSNRKFFLLETRLNQLTQQRNRFFSGQKCFVQWSERYLDYIDSEVRALGGGTFSILEDLNNNEIKGFVVCYPYKNALIIKEVAVHPSCLNDLIATLHEKFQASEYRFQLPAGMPTTFSSDVTPFGMIKWLNKDRQLQIESKEKESDIQPAYMTHVLDGPTLGVDLKLA